MALLIGAVIASLNVGVMACMIVGIIAWMICWCCLVVIVEVRKYMTVVVVGESISPHKRIEKAMWELSDHKTENPIYLNFAVFIWTFLCFSELCCVYLNFAVFIWTLLCLSELCCDYLNFAVRTTRPQNRESRLSEGCWWRCPPVSHTKSNARCLKHIDGMSQ